MNDHLKELNSQQREAVQYGIRPGKVKDIGPLLVIAGAGSGKTQTLAHRAAHLLINGADPHRILLLTFTRRAAKEMTRRAGRIAAGALKARLISIIMQQPRLQNFVILWRKFNARPGGMPGLSQNRRPRCRSSDFALDILPWWARPGGGSLTVEYHPTIWKWGD